MKTQTRAAFLACALLGSLLAFTAPASAQPTPTCAGRPATIVGTPGNDRIVGTPGDDVIVGLGGKDKIFAGRGNDIICGGDGPDLIKGQGGRDKIYGGQGNDRLQGNNGKDTIFGGGGRDSIIGARGDDIINGEGGNDFINAGEGVDACTLDRKDTFTGCENGDVRARTGFGDGGFNVAVPAGWAAHTARVGTPRPYFVLEVVSTGGEEFGFHSVKVLDPAGKQLEIFSESGPDFSGEFLVAGTPGRIEVSAPGSWEVAIKAPKIIARANRTVSGNGPTVYFLKSPLGPNPTGSLTLSDDVSGNVILETFAGDRFPDLAVNEIHPREDGINLYEGDSRQGTYLVSVMVDVGSWEMAFTG